MNAEQSAKVAMYRTVKSTVQAHPSALTASPAFAAAYTTFLEFLGNIDVALTLQEISSKATTETKGDVRRLIVADLRKMTAALKIYGTLNNNRNAQDAGRVTKSTLVSASEDAFIGKAKLIMQTVQEYLPALEPLGVTAEMLDGTLTRLTSYVGMVGNPKHVIGEKRRGTTLIGEYLLAADALLKDRMDPATLLMGPAQAVFVMEYSFSRETPKASYRTRALQLRITDASNGKPLEGVTARIEPGNVEKVSSEAGGFYVSTLDEGAYEMTLARPGYAPKLVHFTVVQRQRTLLEEKLAPAA